MQPVSTSTIVWKVSRENRIRSPYGTASGGFELTEPQSWHELDNHQQVGATAAPRSHVADAAKPDCPNIPFTVILDA